MPLASYLQSFQTTDLAFFQEFVWRRGAKSVDMQIFLLFLDKNWEGKLLLEGALCSSLVEERQLVKIIALFRQLGMIRFIFLSFISFKVTPIFSTSVLLIRVRHRSKLANKDLESHLLFDCN